MLHMIEFSNYSTLLYKDINIPSQCCPDLYVLYSKRIPRSLRLLLLTSFLIKPSEKNTLAKYWTGMDIPAQIDIVHVYDLEAPHYRSSELRHGQRKQFW